MPLMDLFWSMLWFFLFVAWIWLVVSVIGDIFRSRDLSGWGKALWTLFVVVLPWLGVFVYLIARGKTMGERSMRDAVEQEEETRQYIQTVASPNGHSSADEIAKLAELRNTGLLTQDEFEAQKAKLLAHA
jgi:predicted membrane channel-forming protein YqfA (hemolysin III family)